MCNGRDFLKDKKRIVVKIGSSSLMHSETGKLDLLKIERLVGALVDITNSGKEIILVSSGAIVVGKTAIGLHERPDELPVKQACAAIGQAKLMMVYQKLLAEYGTIAAQVLLTKYTMLNPVTRTNAENTFKELLHIGAIPVVNENDTVSTYEIEQVQSFVDNDKLSALVASITEADLLILLSDIDGLYTDDPNKNPDAKFINVVDKIDEQLMNMGKNSSGSSVGTGGMSAKLVAAQIATYSGTDMVITNGNDVTNISRIINGENTGTLFLQHQYNDFNILELI